MLLEHYNIKKGQSHNALQDVLDLLDLLKVIKPERWCALSISRSVSKNDNKQGKDGTKSSAKSNSFRKFAKDKEKVAEEKEMIEFAKNNLIKVYNTSDNTLIKNIEVGKEPTTILCM